MQKSQKKQNRSKCGQTTLIIWMGPGTTKKKTIFKESYKIDKKKIILNHIPKVFTYLLLLEICNTVRKHSYICWKTNEDPQQHGCNLKPVSYLE